MIIERDAPRRLERPSRGWPANRGHLVEHDHEHDSLAADLSIWTLTGPKVPPNSLVLVIVIVIVLETPAHEPPPVGSNGPD